MDHPPKVLQLSDASLAAYQRSRLRPNSSSFLAFYSSHLDGITRDPVLMTVPMDDHMCHRGHAVFDTCNVVDGHAYGLGFHLDRLIKSAGLARIPLQEWDKARLRETVLHTIAAAGRPNDVFVRFWLSVGAGDFSISPKATYGTAFFVMIQQAPPQLSTSTASGKAKMKLDGVREFCVDVPLKPALLANLKSTNYLLNALAAMQSEEKGGYLGIQLDAAGRVAEGAIGNVAIIDQAGMFLTPPFDEILAGTSVRRAFDLGKQLVDRDVLKGFEFRQITPADVYAAKEAFSMGGGHAVPIISLDGNPIGDGKVGPIFKELDALLCADMRAPSEHLDPIPFASLQTSGSFDAGYVWGSRLAGAVFVAGVALAVARIAKSR